MKLSELTEQEAIDMGVHDTWVAFSGKADARARRMTEYAEAKAALAPLKRAYQQAKERYAAAVEMLQRHGRD